MISMEDGMHYLSRRGHKDKNGVDALSGGSVKVIEIFKESNRIDNKYYRFTGGQR